MQTSKGIMPRPACMLPRDDATSGHDSNVLRLSSDLIGPVEPRGYDGTRYLIGFTKEFINWLDMQDFKDKHTTRRLHLDNDTDFHPRLRAIAVTIDHYLSFY